MTDFDRGYHDASRGVVIPASDHWHYIDGMNAYYASL